MATTINLIAGQISDLIEVGPGTRITVTGSAYIDYAQGNVQDAKNGVLTWAKWPKGSSSGTCDTIRRMTIRATATGSASVLIEEGFRDADTDSGYWQEQTAQLVTDAAGMVHVLKSRSSPASGVALVTGTTTEQFFELADLSSLLRVDDAVTVDITLAYTGSTNGKYITYYLGPNTSSLATLAGTTRTSGTEVSMRANFEFFIQDMNSVGRISSALGVIGTSATAVLSQSVDVGQPSLKLYVGLKLASAAEQITVHKYAVLLQRSN